MSFFRVTRLGVPGENELTVFKLRLPVKLHAANNLPHGGLFRKPKPAQPDLLFPFLRCHRVAFPPLRGQNFNFQLVECIPDIAAGIVRDQIQVGYTGIVGRFARPDTM